MSTINFLQDYRLYDFFTNSNKITLFKDGENRIYEKDTDEFNEIMSAFTDMIYNSFEMPAYGVSLHNETVKAMQNGIWIKFEFPEEQTHNEMPFNALLINVVPDYVGFNLIREIDGEYKGRCYYLNLENKDMSGLYSTCENIKFKD